MMFDTLLKALLIFSVATMSAVAAEKVVECEQKIEDYSGEEICIPKTIDKMAITCYGGASQEIALFMGADAIIAQPSVDRFQQFLNVYPNLKTVKSVGTFNDINLEYLLKLNPDIVFVGITSTPTNQRIQDMNIPTYALGIGRHNIQTLLEEFSHVGKILKKEQKAQELIEYWHTKMDMIKSKTSTLKPPERKRVFYTSGYGGLSSENKHGWGDEFIQASGGINVITELQMKGTLSSEMLSVWNPDIIIASTNKSPNNSADKLIQNPSYKNIKAVRNGDVYKAPIGTFWWDRPSPESILGFIWLSKILYPDLMRDVDLKSETKEFYERFYDYTLSDQEYQGFFTQ
jgi:iron complex transport system substrate-binding protein